MTLRSPTADERRADDAWSPERADDHYGVSRWSNGYFEVGDHGTLLCRPRPGRAGTIDLLEVVDSLRERGVELPVLLRFSGILAHRVHAIQQAFDRAIAEHEYGARHYAVYPIKVNQQRHVVDEIQRAGSALGHGLEAGSKPELLAVLALADDDTPIVCNGFKDHEYIEIVIMAHRLGRTITPVVEKATELDLILEEAQRHDVRPRIGVRVKLMSPGAGRWRESAGSRSKFGLTAGEVVAALRKLDAAGMADCLRLLHFHMGSQITEIRQIKQAVSEAARIYVELRSLGAVGLDTLDVGGGLGVDYDGSQSDFDSSVNYTLQEYANDVVHHVGATCDEAETPHPDIVTECGRAVSAYHSVLLFDVLGASGGLRPVGEEVANGGLPEEADLGDDAPQPLSDLLDTLSALQAEAPQRGLLEAYHDAQNALEESLTLFRLGYLRLEQRALAERLYHRICVRLRTLAQSLEHLPEELAALDDQLTATYFCNFSVFQSLPDSWAVDQLFPVMPIHRLGEEPTVHAILADISCDSDGKIDRFIDRPGGARQVQRRLALHPLEPATDYTLGAFLVGAYQEILGDLHNLLGDTNAIHVDVDDEGAVDLEELILGDTVREVLHYVQFETDALVGKLRRDLEKAVRAGRIDARTSGRFLRSYTRALDRPTYLTRRSAEGEPPT